MDEQTPEQVVADQLCRNLCEMEPFCPTCREDAADVLTALRAQGYAVVKVDEDVRSDLRVAIADEIGGAEVGESDLWCAVDAVLAALGLSEPVETERASDG